jgi:hypothetical protein
LEDNAPSSGSANNDVLFDGKIDLITKEGEEEDI